MEDTVVQLTLGSDEAIVLFSSNVVRIFRNAAREAYFTLAGGTIPFMRRYSTICP
jgi:hypothetical protein